jgi:uncharacterized membrane protein
MKMAREKENRTAKKEVATSIASVLLALITFIVILWAITAIISIVLSVKF